MNRSRSDLGEADSSIEEYGAKTKEKEECEEQLLAEYASLLGFFITSVAVLTGIAMEKDRLPRRFSLLDLALLGIATHKMSRIVAKDRITAGPALPAPTPIRVRMPVPTMAPTPSATRCGHERDCLRRCSSIHVSSIFRASVV